MAGGQIDGFFKKVKPGQPLRSLANVDNLNKVANVLNDITGEGCTIDKPTDGRPWTVTYSGNLSDNKPLLMPQDLQVEIQAVNQAVYQSSSNKVFPSSVSITVNGVAVSPASELPISWTPTAGVKYLLILQHFSAYTLDTDGQYTGSPYYVYATDTTGGGWEYTPVAKIPYCRLEIPEVGKPPKIKCLLEGPLSIYCYRGDADTRAYAPEPINPSRQIQKSKTVDNSGNGELPVKVRNISASADGFFNEYPNGRYRIVHSASGDEVEWLDPDETAVAKNNAKAMLLRYIDHGSLVMHGQPFWCNVEAFKHYGLGWIEDYVTEDIDNTTPTWLISILRPWAMEIWNEMAEMFEEVCPNVIDGKEVLAAVMGSDGEWKSIVDIVVTEEEFDLTLEGWNDLSAWAEGIIDTFETASSTLDDTEESLDEIEDEIDALPDYSPIAQNWETEALSEADSVADMDSDFTSLDARITALEQRFST